MKRSVVWSGWENAAVGLHQRHRASAGWFLWRYQVSPLHPPVQVLTLVHPLLLDQPHIALARYWSLLCCWNGLLDHLHRLALYYVVEVFVRCSAACIVLPVGCLGLVEIQHLLDVTNVWLLWPYLSNLISAFAAAFLSCSEPWLLLQKQSFINRVAFIMISIVRKSCQFNLNIKVRTGPKFLTKVAPSLLVLR